MENNPLEPYKAKLQAALQGAVSSINSQAIATLSDAPEDINAEWTYPCFALAKQFNVSPKEMAEKIASQINVQGISVSVINGFINFSVDIAELAQNTHKIISEIYKFYGSGQLKDIRIILEHTSANPTDKLHVGRGRNPIIGDTLAKMLSFSGYKVESHYYVDDMGRQAVILAIGKEMYNNTEFRSKVISIIPEAQSLGEYQFGNIIVSDEHNQSILKATSIDCKAMLYVWLQKLESGDVEISKKVQTAAMQVLNEKIKPTLNTINAIIDEFDFESKYVVDGSVNDIISKLKLKAPDNENGAYYIDMANHGVSGKDTRFFYTREDGTSLYTTRDLAYHLFKLNKFDKAINILGEDHKLQAKQLSVGLDMLGESKKPEVVFYSFVRLPDGKMSTRSGNVVFLDDLIQESVKRAYDEVKKHRPDIDENKANSIAQDIGTSAVRYNIIKVQPEKSMVFKWEEALNFEGNSAPYIQYAYARCCSILNKIDETKTWVDTRHIVGSKLNKQKNDFINSDWSLLKHPSEQNLIRKISMFPTMVERNAESRRTHMMASDVYSIAMTFNQFYRDCQVICDDEKLQNARVALVKATEIVLWNGMYLLGLKALGSM